MLYSISLWDTQNVIDMGFLFSRCSSLISLPDISKWNLTNAKNINAIFSECSSLITLPNISNWFNYNIDIDYTPRVNQKYKFEEYFFFLDLKNYLKITVKIYHIYFVIVHN